MSQTKAQLIDTLVASLLPASDSSVDIGSNAVRFANIYGDTLYGSGANLTGLNIVTDTSPQLGGNLDVNTKNILFGDSSDGASDDVLIFGAGSDLKIYHSGSHSIIQETGTGNLLLCGTRVNILNSATNEILLSAQENGPVELHYDNSKKFETTSSGATITGTCQATDFNSTSDIRLKTNIQTIEDPLAKIIQIEGVSFNWKENNKPALGVIADQVEKIIPELVTDGDPKTVNYNGLIGLLIEAVKEQQVQITELKSKLDSLSWNQNYFINIKKSTQCQHEDGK